MEMSKYLIVGDSSGIGEACRNDLLKRGHAVFGCSRTPEGPPIESENYERANWDVRTLPPDRILRALHYPGLGGVLMAAGLSYLSPYRDLDMSVVRDVIDVNLVGTLNLLKYVDKYCYSGVSVVIISSVAAYTPMRNSSVYCATKAAQDAIVKQAAREFGNKHPVIGIRPGYVKGTRLTDYVQKLAMEQKGMTEEEYHAYNLKTSVVGRYPTMEEVVSVTNWALTTSNALALTGSFLNPSCGS